MDAQLTGYRPKGEASAFGLLHSLPQGPLASGRYSVLLRSGLPWPQVPVHLTCFQGLQARLLLGFRAIDAAGQPGACRRGGVRCSQLSRAWRSLLCGESLPVVVHQEPAIRALLDLDLHAGVRRTTSVRQQLQGPPFVLDGVVPGHLAPVFEAEYLIQGHGLLQATVGKTVLLGLYPKPLH